LVDAQIESQAAETGLPVAEILDRVMLAPAAIKRLIEPDEVAGLVAYLGWTAR
jgi:3-hydroxybutyrate dehydrogenase